MAQDKVLEIIKKALLLERRGKAFYETVASHASGTTLKRFFAMMADEESNHIEMLTTHYKSITQTSHLKPTAYHARKSDDFSSKVLTGEIKKEISAAGYEAAAISAAINMEQMAVNLYAGQAAAATDPEEKKLFDWLASWERTHLDYLVALDNELRESIWFDNKFWPM